DHRVPVMIGRRDFIGGLLLLVGGLTFSWYAASHYNLGTLRQMGSAMFPAGLGAILAFFGAVLMVQSWFQDSRIERIELRTPFLVILSIAAFAFLVLRVGIIPASLATIVISSFADLKVGIGGLILLCAILCGLAYVIFSVALGIPTPMLRWPF